MSKVVLIPSLDCYVVSGASLQDLTSLPVITIALTGASVVAVDGTGAQIEADAKALIPGSSILFEITKADGSVIKGASSVKIYQDLVFVLKRSTAKPGNSVVRVLRTAGQNAAKRMNVRSCCGR